MGALSDRINNLGTQDRHKEPWSNTETAWLAGFDTGLYEAEQLAEEADELMEEMAKALQRFMGVDASEAIDADHAYTEYLKWRGCNNGNAK